MPLASKTPTTPHPLENSQTEWSGSRAEIDYAKLRADLKAAVSNSTGHARDRRAQPRDRPNARRWQSNPIPAPQIRKVRLLYSQRLWTGWIAFLIFIPLAVTSMDYFARRMGPSWKTLQRMTYAAAVLTLVHRAALYNWCSVGPALAHFGPLAALEAYRIWYWFLRPRRTTGS